MFSAVFKATLKSETETQLRGGKPYALKCVYNHANATTTPEINLAYAAEFEVLQRCLPPHENIIRVLHVFIDHAQHEKLLSLGGDLPHSPLYI